MSLDNVIVVFNPSFQHCWIITVTSSVFTPWQRIIMAQIWMQHHECPLNSILFCACWDSLDLPRINPKSHKSLNGDFRFCLKLLSRETDKGLWNEVVWNKSPEWLLMSVKFQACIMYTRKLLVPAKWMRSRQSQYTHPYSIHFIKF